MASAMLGLLKPCSLRSTACCPLHPHNKVALASGAGAT